jgi:hypothetical protein
MVAAALGSCAARPTLPEWRYPGFDQNHTHVVPVAWRAEWIVEPVAVADLPSGAGSDATLLFADIVAGPEPEIVICGTRSLAIFGESGNLIAERALAEPHRAGLAADYDGDGKEDVYFGTVGAARPVVRIWNGRGDVIYEFGPDDSASDYRSFLPVLLRDGRLYVLARENWPDSPRGLLCYRVPGFQELWDFALPSDPLSMIVQPGRSGSEVFTFSGTARAQGVFQHLGRDRSSASDLDAAVRLFRTNPAGEVVGQHAVTVGGATLAGNAEFLPLGPDPADALLLIHRSAQDPEASTPTALHVLEAETGVAMASYLLGEERLGGIRVVTGPDQARIVLLTATGPASSRLRLMDERLRVLLEADLDRGPAVLGTVLAPSASRTDAMCFFVLTPGALMLYDSSLRGRTVAVSHDATQMLCSATGDRGLIVLLGKELEILRLAVR